jgi:serine/threonine-protein kinase
MTPPGLHPSTYPAGAREPVSESRVPVRVVGRYALYGEIASGGMATVHLGRLIGPVGFARTVAVKSLHPGFAKDPEFVSMFLDEARLAARVRHPNVVSTIDVVVGEGELFLVMEYVAGESLAKLVRFASARGERVPLAIATTLVATTLHGLHAAHEALSDRGEPLGLVHRDVSPQNVLVGTDGIARVIDFGVAKAQGRAQTTREGQVKGKIAYMAPEQLLGDATRLSDIYAVGLILWEIVAGRRAFEGDSEASLMARVLHATLAPPSTFVTELSTLSAAEQEAIHALDAVVMRAVARDPAARFRTAEEMALAIQAVIPQSPARDVGAWVAAVGSDALAARLRAVAEVESASAMVAVASVKSDRPPSIPGIESSRRSWSSNSLASLQPARAIGSGGSEIETEVEIPQPRTRGLRWLVGASVALALVTGLVAAFVAGGAGRRSDSAGSSANAARQTAAPADSATVSSATAAAPTASAGSAAPTIAPTGTVAADAAASAPVSAPVSPSRGQRRGAPANPGPPSPASPAPAPRPPQNPNFL